MVVATSVLSERWRPLWLSVPTVDLDDEGYVQTNESHLRFVRLSYAVMLSRDVTQPILNFRLKCESTFFLDNSDIRVWVNAAIQRKVETIELSLPRQNHIKLPHVILTCSSLVVLKLRGLTVDGISTVCLPMLKVLHLVWVRFVRRQYFQMLLSGFPILEDLHIESLLPWDGAPYVAGFKRLPKLVRADISSIVPPISEFPNVEFLRIRVANFTVPAVTFHNLIHMELSVFNCKRYLLVGLLKCCPLLQILIINEDTSDWSVSGLQNQPYPQSVPECLSSHLRVCTLRNFGGDADVRFALYIIQHARVLRKMTIYSTSSSRIEEKFQMLKDLSKVSRSSTTCELLFE